MSMDFHLPRADQLKLQEALGGIPTLIEDLAVTITRQARVQKPGLGKLRRRKAEARIPFHIGAVEAADELHNALIKWVRFTCDARQTPYTESNDDITLARWLRRNVTALALIEGSEESWPEIHHRIDECRKQIDLPPEDDIVIDPERVRQANRQILTAGQIEKIAPRLGALGAGLNKRRVQTLVKSKRLRPCAVDGEVRFYRLGDVLDAHHRQLPRSKKTTSEQVKLAE
ncbi:hypothetical protein I5H93_gp094 [Mycobacterium phage SuperGrey]|uniref:Helix-turn-helix DNA binding domain protein n=13 Tax=root TaxID=1 RepID=A0A385E291_9CAUD|nr:hypothetical protein PBI_BOBI_96 [Mycobacterium phage Bobi]YP_008410771.1 hypothetical protein N850_gp098 [Mycobacterium phage Jabbawokkie]YP_009013194.1 hypothetical protein CL78_gp099 [Mycobacterium phage Avani]YP_009013296.1 hypothetical protein CL94_gp094 [Mycobacterium phage SG4]YP_009200722.1 hypothetical protein AVT13_gp095 [Mycobacterium phage Bipolar]YP_009841127.1 hypothetical protein HWB85_gp102 [Mycobacterium phage Renaud18]YP_009856276.1 helix-turn-helix DNA binding domain pro